MTADHKKMSRDAQFLIVEIARGYGTPPYHADWQPLWDCKVESIIDNINASPSEAVFYMPAKRWNDDLDIHFGDKIKILGYDDKDQEKVLFVGFVTKKLSQFSGGTEKGGKYERRGFMALDIRWLIAVNIPIYGQLAIGAGDEDEAGFPLEGKYSHFGGRRCIFNPDGISNRHKDGVDLDDKKQPCFVNPDAIDKDSMFWTYEDIVKYILGPAMLINISEYVDIDADSIFNNIKSDRSDWIKIESNISIEGLNSVTALQYIAKKIGWVYRIEYEDDEPKIVLSKAGKSQTKHSLYSPPAFEPGDNMNSVQKAVSAGKVMVSFAQFEEDITNVVNSPYLLAAPMRVEFRAEYVPAWLDSDLIPDTSDDNAHLFISEVELEGLENPSQFSFFKKYHSASKDCLLDVGRIWALNETGRYSLNTTYDRGEPFDLSTVIPKDFAFDASGKKAYGYYDHVLLPCLSQILQNSVGILVEISFDRGSTWQQLQAAVAPLEKEAGIMITEANLAEIKPKPSDSISGGTLDGIELNYWTSLCNDKLSNSSYSSWQTKIRVTASIQLERRMETQIAQPMSGSPFYQADVIDVSNAFFKQARHSSSSFSAAKMPANERDDYVEFKDYIDKLRNALQDTAISGRIGLERLWLDRFHCGDCIKNIAGRDYDFVTSMGSQQLYPEIVQIIYLVQKQKMQLITRDLRFSENR